jgi:transposase
MYRDGGIEAVRGRTAPGWKRRLSPEQEARSVQRVKAGASPRDGIASLRGPQIQGIPDRDFGKTFSLAGIYKLLKRSGFVCVEPRPRHPRQDPVAARAFKRRAPLL